MQIALIVFVVLLLFGGRKIPELMRGLGKGMKEFKDASSNLTDDSDRREDRSDDRDDRSSDRSNRDDDKR
jgi:sec-independent protein translocase protein TatA|tara:strand:- start:639 stop:848 length:210 start_codon:yes stop_codon:yes gene_type:complete